jgi:hypothetical protein
MPRVEALNGHPYGGRFHLKGDHYDVAEGDLELMVGLKRVRALSKAEVEKEIEDFKKQQADQTYKTREMRAGIIGTRGTVEVGGKESPAEVAQKVESVEPRRGRAPSKPADQK